MSKKSFWFVVITAIIVVAGVLGFKALHSEGKDNAQKGPLKELRIQFVPSSQGDKMEARTKPLEKLLSEELNMPVHVSISTDYNTVVEALGSKQIDLGFLPPHPYVYAHEKYNANVLLQAQRYEIDTQKGDGSQTNELTNAYRGAVIVKKDSPIKKPEDLKGKSIAVQSTTSDSGFIFQTVELDKNNKLNVLKDAKLVTVKGHDQGILSVLNGDTDAAFVFEEAPEIVKGDKPNVYDEIRFIKYTQPIPNDNITVRAGISSEDTKKIQDAMIKIFNEDKVGKQVMKDVYRWIGVTKSSDDNYNIVREYQDYIDNMK